MNSRPDSPASVEATLKDRNQSYLDELQRSGKGVYGVQALATILNCIADGLIVLDEELNIVLCNKAAAAMAHNNLDDYSREQLRRDYQLYREDGVTPLPNEEEPIVIAMRERKPCEMKGHAKGTSLVPTGVWLRVHAAPIIGEEGHIAGGVTVFHDISEQRRLAKQRDCLSALIVHDIKNHLAAETGLFEILSGLIPPEANKALTNCLNELKKSSQRFVGMTETLLEVSRADFFDTAGYGCEIDLEPLMDAAVQSNLSVATLACVTVSAKFDPSARPIVGIPSVVQQLFHNIVLNAIEASPLGTNVEIVVSAVPDTPFTRIAVTDHGPGMTAEEITHLFDPRRVATHMKTTNATGFGLYLSAMLVEGQGGRISCQSALGKGTTIIIEMPTVQK